MKERRLAIIVEFLLFLIGLLFLLFNFKNDSNVYKNIFIPICISILSGSFLALCIELPRYILNYRMMLDFIISIARRIGNLLCAYISTIERSIQSPQTQTSEYHYDKLMDNLRDEFFVFSKIDSTLFICKCKKNLLENIIKKTLHFTDQSSFTQKFNSKIIETTMKNLEIEMKNHELNNQLMQKQYLGIPPIEEPKYENKIAITNEIVMDELHEMKSKLVILLKLIDTTMTGILKGKNLLLWKNIINIINSRGM